MDSYNNDVTSQKKIGPDFLNRSSLIYIPTDQVPLYELLSNKLKLDLVTIFMIGFCIGYNSAKKLPIDNLDKNKQIRYQYLDEDARGLIYAAAIKEGLINKSDDFRKNGQVRDSVEQLMQEYTHQGIYLLNNRLTRGDVRLDQLTRIDILTTIMEYFIELQNKVPF
mgnify:CR=1 FL=1